jgi:hypothetical protein
MSGKLIVLLEDDVMALVPRRPLSLDSTEPLAIALSDHNAKKAPRCSGRLNQQAPVCDLQEKGNRGCSYNITELAPTGDST